MLSIPPPQRPPSRSERLLRETLRRSDEVRDTSISSPPRKSSPSRRSSSRRVTSPPPPPLPPLELYSRPASPGQRCRYAELADEQYRGNFLFRSAINNAPHSPSTEVFYSPKTESDGTMTPGSRSRFFDGKRPHTSTHSTRLSTRSISPSPPPTRDRTTVTRRHSLQRAFYHEPLTPQEHALRARLGNMLRPETAHMTNLNMASDPNGESHWRDSDFTARSGSTSQPQSGASIWSSPPPSTPILHSTSSPSLQDNSYRTHTRSRSSTDPIRTPSHANTHIPPYSITRARTGATTNTSTATSSSSTSMSTFSPRRNAPSSATYPHYPHHPSHQSQVLSHQQLRRTIEGTPPLTADTSPIGISAGNELEPDYQLDADDSRLITPPPSPPPSHLNGSSRKSHHHHLPHSPLPCRPSGDWYPAFTVPGSEEDTVNPNVHSHAPLSGPRRTEFNVRKASEQCKLIDGYVSFLNIEGLGGPPESNSPAIGDDEGEGDDRSREKRMFGIGWDRWKKLLPLTVVGSNVTAGVHEAAVSR